MQKIPTEPKVNSAITDLKIVKFRDHSIVFNVTNLKFFKVEDETAKVILEIQKNPMEYTQLLENQVIKEFLTPDQPNAAHLVNRTYGSLLVFLNLSHLCNLQCSYCFAKGYLQKAEPEKFMNKSTAKKAVDFAFRFAVASKIPFVKINFTGGEPLLNFETLKLVTRYAKGASKKNGLELELIITTNGTLLNVENVSFLKRNNFLVEISLDGNKKSHDFNRKFKSGEGTYDEVAFNLKLLKNYNKKIAIATTTPETRKYMFENFLHIHKLGFNRIIFGTVTSQESGCIINEEDVDDVISGFDEIIKFTVESNKKGKKLSYPQLSSYLRTLLYKIPRTTPCDMGRNLFCIAPNGTIYPCYRLVNDDFAIGNVNDEHLDIRTNKICTSLAKISPDYSVDCKTCWAKNVCGGGDAECPANLYQRTGSFHESHLKTRCQIAQAMIESVLRECEDLTQQQLKTLTLA